MSNRIDLHSYRTGSYIRPATAAEAAESLAEAAGTGAFLASVDGAEVPCYVIASAVPSTLRAEDDDYLHALGCAG